MALVNLIARRMFAHDGRERRTGDLFTTSAVQAAILIRREDAAFAPMTVAAHAPARRHTKRRDLTPEPD